MSDAAVGTSSLEEELDTRALMQLALEDTGAAGFDDERFVESMDHWLRGVATEGRLTPMGVMGMKSNVHRILVNRLRIETDVRLHPEILDEDVSAPIIVTGIPRTGTTKLQRLLSNDAKAAPVPLWRLLNPAPLPGTAAGEPEPRIAVAEQFVEILNQMFPDWQTGHPTGALYPDEETFAMEMTFDSVVNACRAQSRSVRQWWLAQPKDYAYEYLRLILQYWQWQDGGTRDRPFILKSPDHIGNLDRIAATFPGALVVHCHRDPVVAVPSAARLIESMLVMSSDDVDLADLGDWSMRYFAKGSQRNIVQRDQLGDSLNIVDVRFTDIVRNAGQVVRDVHRARGRELTAEEEAEMVSWEEEAPHSKTHSYSLERYHLTAEQIQKAFAPYIDRFGEVLR
jgi:hypothetical protein